MEKEYIVYKAENKENGYVYVGTTTKSIEERKKDHLQRVDKSYSSKFHEAIGTYGIEAFTWEQVDTANSTDELAKKEKEYIIKYNSKDDGYNSDSGGGFKKIVYQYSLDDGSLIGSFNCLESAGSAINATKQQISRACLSVNKEFAGYYWSYEYKEPFKPIKDKRFKEVNQYSLDGNLINTYKSISEASEETGVNKGNIAKVCRQERNTAGGYRWVYK